jgi:hypothetical protein
MDAAAAWQRRIDREFPDGAVCSWELPADQTPVIYVTPRIVVVDMAGLDPVVTITPLDNSRVLGPARVASYSPARGSRWPPGTMRVTFHEGDHYPGVMYWNPKVPAVLANRLGDQEPGQ